MSGQSLVYNQGLRVKRKRQGRGIFAVQSFAVGEQLAMFEEEFVDSPDRYTIQVDVQKHLVTVGQLGAFLNHSCDPNTRFLAETLEIIALKPVQKGEEITFNYLSSEWDMASPFACTYGAAQCKGYIQGFRYLSPAEQLQYRDMALPYLQRLMSQAQALGS